MQQLSAVNENFQEQRVHTCLPFCPPMSAAVTPGPCKTSLPEHAAKNFTLQPPCSSKTSLSVAVRGVGSVTNLAMLRHGGASSTSLASLAHPPCFLLPRPFQHQMPGISRHDCAAMRGLSNSVAAQHFAKSHGAIVIDHIAHYTCASASGLLQEHARQGTYDWVCCSTVQNILPLRSQWPRQIIHFTRRRERQQ